MSYPTLEECPYCHKRIFSRANHIMFCTAINEDMDPSELEDNEELMNNALHSILEPVRTLRKRDKR